MKHYPLSLWMIILSFCLVLSVTFAIVLGTVSIDPIHVWKIILHPFLQDSIQVDWPTFQSNIVWEIRLPRVMLGACVGAGLAFVGAILQALIRNPLADPYLFGVSSGASAGAVSFIIFIGSSRYSYMLPFTAFLGALLATGLVFFIMITHRKMQPSQWILAGVAVGFIFTALTNLIIFSAENRGATQRAIFWMLGGLGNAEWSQFFIACLVLVFGSLYLSVHGRSLNALMIGEESAITLGVNVNRLRKSLFIICALITGVMVAFSGAIGFVGLMLPHIVRMLVGADHRRVLPICLLAGAIFLIWVDVIGRTVLSPEELPIGIVTALIGAPFFIWLMQKRFQYREK